MRFLVISDTHKFLHNVVGLLEKPHQFDRIIHLGDVVTDGETLENIFNIPVEGVAGNSDPSNSSAPASKVLEVCNKKIYLCHGHHEQVKRNDGLLRELIKSEGYDIVLYGHTHMASLDYEGDSILMNPGSMTIPKDGGPSYGTIDIDEKGNIHTNIVRI